VPLLRSGNPERTRLQRQIDALDDRIDELDPKDYAEQRKALRQQLNEQGSASQSSPILVVAMAGFILSATFLLYQQVGEPEGVDTGNTPTSELRGELIRIANSLERDPDNVENWTRLGLAYRDIGELSSAEHALRRALYLDEDNGFIMVELAETLLYASQTPRLPAESRSLLERAAQTEPDNQKALWLLGIGAFQDNDYAGALDWWGQLERQLPEGSVRNSVREQMQRARARLEGGEATDGERLPPGHPPLAQTDSESQPSFRVTIELDPELRENLSGSEVVFLIARAAEGPAAPLAVRRLTVNDLPASVALSDADAMVEGLEISSFPELILTARVSFTGDAQARDGDLEGQTGPVSILEAAAAEVRIDRVVNRSSY
jgi:cytochrome c-type biogenesis protein CcmH